MWPGWQGWCRGALPLGPVTGCVFLGLAGRRMRGQQEKLQVIYEGERGQRGVSGGWRGGEKTPGRELRSLSRLGRAPLPSWMRGSVGRSERFQGHVGCLWPAPSGRSCWPLLSPGRGESWLGWRWQEGFLGSLQIRVLTSALFLFLPALQGMTDDISLSVSNLAAQTLLLLRAAERNPSSNFRLLVLQDQLRRAWRRRPSLRDSGWLCCWSSVQS